MIQAADQVVVAHALLGVSSNVTVWLCGSRIVSSGAQTGHMHANLATINNSWSAM